MQMALAAESTHWYAADGSPCYTIIGKNGNERPTTLADARKRNLFPSVTTILRQKSAPQLERWKRNQVLLAALTLPRLDGESESDWLARVENDWQEQGKKAADTGTHIHAAIEQQMGGGYFGELWTPWIIAALAELLDKCGTTPWGSEKSFTHPAGYGGRVDLHAPSWVLDIKTKDGELPTSTYDEQEMQIAAYRRGLGLDGARGGILYVRRDKPEARLIEIPEPKLQRGGEMFDALLLLFFASTGYRPQP